MTESKYFAAIYGFHAMTGRDSIKAAKRYAAERAKFYGLCNIYEIENGFVYLVETVFKDGTTQKPLFHLRVIK